MSDSRAIFGAVQCGEGEMTPFVGADLVEMEDGIVISLPIKRSNKTEHGSPVKVLVPMLAARRLLTELSRVLEAQASPPGGMTLLVAQLLKNQQGGEEPSISGPSASS